MNERLLQFIWQFQYFNHASLATDDEKPLQIIHAGTLNSNQGPDFHEGRIRLDDKLWVGNIELHVNASEWHQHHHSSDKNYDNIILHVVWHNDADIRYPNGETIPVLELQSLVPKILLQRFDDLMYTNDAISCSNSLPVLNDVTWTSWKERLLVERLQERSETIAAWLGQENEHWEEVFWRCLARAFGMKVNADVFEQIAQALPVNLLARHKHQIHQLEALLLGQGNLLSSSFDDDYPVMLQKEYKFLAKKYGLKAINKLPDFLRMRPHNFPTIRLAQLAMLVHQSSHLFSKIKTAEHPNEVFQWFDISANDFWRYHYTLFEETAYHSASPGRTFIQHVVINAIIPMFFSYGHIRREQSWKDKAISWFLQLAPEENVITKKWKAHGIENKTAFDSQALIQLKKNYCDRKRCLECAIGAKLLRATHQPK